MKEHEAKARMATHTICQELNFELHGLFEREWLGMSRSKVDGRHTV